ncbi:MAG: hypothetical protein PHV68_07110 [Candidatus Gastranaerophilales bacterium]|nr:hypothetical protein [Candidatus Gastranaerophilales bacterium]
MKAIFSNFQGMDPKITYNIPVKDTLPNLTAKDLLSFDIIDIKGDKAVVETLVYDGNTAVPKAGCITTMSAKMPSTVKEFYEMITPAIKKVAENSEMLQKLAKRSL